MPAVKKVWFEQVHDKRQIVILCMAAGFLGGFVLLRYLPLRRREQDIVEAKTERAAMIAKAQRQRGELPALKEKLAEMESAVANYERNVPSERNLGVFLHRIAALMNEHELSDQLVEPGGDIGANSLRCIPVSVRCEGELEQVFEFLRALEGLERTMRVEEASFVSLEGFDGRVRVQTKAIIYYRPEKQTGQG